MSYRIFAHIIEQKQQQEQQHKKEKKEKYANQEHSTSFMVVQN